jgi:hypothetical protein
VMCMTLHLSTLNAIFHFPSHLISLFITSNIRLFADDCTIYSQIRTKEDQVLLQNDLNKLIKWEGKRKMAFNVDKCNVMHIIRAKKQRNIHT